MYEKRRQRVKKQLEENGIQVALVTKDENKYYLSGFHSSNFYIVLTSGRDYLITDFRYIEKARQYSQQFEVVRLKDDPAYIFDFMGENFSDMQVGIEEEDMKVSFYKKLSDRLGSKNLTSLKHIVEHQRSVKDEGELDKIKKAASIADAGFSHILKFIKRGVSERDIAFELEFFMRKNGAQGLSFDIIVAFGQNTSLPHGSTGDTRLKEGDMITMDFGCKYEGYCSDMTRTLAFGSVTKDMKRVYDIVKDAQSEASRYIKPGIAANDADKKARDIIQEQGFGEFFGHGLGHGVGLEIHESPSLNKSSRIILEQDMVVTVEPGIYIPGEYGVRIEDLAIVKNGGIINLCNSSKELIVI